MAVIPFGEYRPDLSDLNSAFTSSIMNVMPRADGYGPLSGISLLTSALPSQCCGAFYARNPDGSISVFGATATNLYLLNNTTFAWTLVSKTGGYTGVASGALWQFVQFNNYVIAVQQNAVPQYFTLQSSSKFSNLPGSPPQAAYISVVGAFAVLSGITSAPYRVQWSGLEDPTNWTPGVNSSDYQDFADGGTVRGVTGGEMGYVFQDQAIRAMVFSPGSDVIFIMERIAYDIGLLAPYSLVNAGTNVFFLAAQGFQMLNGGTITQIGKERVDRTFFANWNASNMQYMLGSHAPESGSIFWAYQSQSGGSGGFDSGFVYDPVLDRWAPWQMGGQLILSLARPGLTLEALDAIAPGSMAVTGAANNGSGAVRIAVADTTSLTNGGSYTIDNVGGATGANGTFYITIIDGTHFDLIGSTFGGAYTSGGIVAGSIEAFPYSFDNIPSATLPQMGVFDLTGAFGFMSGPALEAVLLTGEQSGVDRRVGIQGFWPITDAPSAYGNVAKRDNLNSAASYTVEQPMNGRGFIPSRADTRHARGRLRIPAGTLWSFARGIDPMMSQKGKR